MTENETIRRQLEELAEPSYQKFASSLIPGVQAGWFLGVRLPKLRRIAAGLAKGNWQHYLEQASDSSFEEIMLQGMVIGYAKGIPEEIQTKIRDFLPKINNWSVCDSFCSGLKIAREYPEEMWEFLQPFFQDTEEYTVRFAVVMLLNYYISEKWIAGVYECLECVNQDTYYVKMAVAWAVSICYISFPIKTMDYLERCSLDDFTYNKALQKIIESRCVDQETKVQIKKRKR